MDNKLLTREEYDQWVKTIPKGVCTFCKWKKYQITIFEGYEWVWIANIAPYWKRHTLLIPKRHFSEYKEMTDSEAVEFKQIMNKAVSKYKALGYDRFVHFWRKRLTTLDKNTGKQKFDHFHVHLCDDFDGLWDPILDNEATDWNIERFK